MRILITGSRTWVAKSIIRTAILFAIGNPDWNKDRDEEVVIVSGHCGSGADKLAEEVAHELGLKVELHPADWKRGKQAGYARNTEMVKLGADVCLAFIKDHSKGASHAARIARLYAIPTRIFER